MKINPQIKDDLKKILIEKMRKESQKVTVTSSYLLSVDDIALLCKKFGDINFKNATYTVDSTVIAGIVITIGSQIIDLSLKGQLSNLQHTIYESA